MYTAFPCVIWVYLARQFIVLKLLRHYQVTGIKIWYGMKTNKSKATFLYTAANII
jgi:hypothetical protein